MSSPPTDRRALAALARLHRVQGTYTDSDGRRRRLGSDGLVALLRALGAPIERVADAPEALAEETRRLWGTPLEPVHVVWGRSPLRLGLRLPQASCSRALELEVLPEGGGEPLVRRRVPAAELLGAPSASGDGFQRLELTLPCRLPPGRHTLCLSAGALQAESTVLAAPRHAPRSAGAGWGLFLPLYALRAAGDWGIGDFTRFGDLAELVGRAGGELVGTLPLLAAFLGEPFAESPYAPASRLFWNEVFLDVEALPELDRSAAAREALGSADFRRELAELRAAPLVDYARQMALKRRVLEPMPDALAGARLEAFERFLAERPDVLDYARFRAVTDRLRRPWQDWPERLRAGDLRPEDGDPRLERFHAYLQWAASEQVGALARRSRDAGPALYLDLPLGVHSSSYDVYRERALFVEGVSVGAPPDPFFTGGQDWGFPPLHPEALRRQGYRHLQRVLQHSLEPSAVLRIDHVMALHRLYFVPHGAGAREGGYVRYREDELYALVCLEAWRAGTELVGEDLGTVPAGVRRAMERHGLRRMYVAQFSASSRRPPLRDPPEGSLASLNTHDMSPLAAFWSCADVEDRRSLGLLDQAQAEAERARREHLRELLVRFLRERGFLQGPTELSEVLGAWLEFLAASRARYVLVNAEDLWLDPAPQNTPGTWRERPNWRRRARLSLEEIRTDPAIEAVLRRVDRKRRQT